MVEGDNYSPRNYGGISQMPQSTSKKSGKIIWIIFGVLVVLAIVVGVILLNPFSNKISSSDLSSGINVDLKENAKINFETNEEKHKITIDSINVDSIDIIIRSEIIIANLNIGETKKFDLNGDGVYDLSIKLKDITDGKANLFIQKIDEVVCTENWECTEWEECVSDLQIRVCVDGNSCGTTDNKPDEEQTCAVEESEDALVDEEESTDDLVDESCEDKGLYSIDEERNGLCNSVQAYSSGTETIYCCNYLPVYPVTFSDELRVIWSSIQNSGDCTDFVSKLSSCSLYKCSFIHPLTTETFEKGVIGEDGGKCHSLEEMPNNGEQYCQYSDSQLVDMVDYYNFYEEQCGEGTCSIVINSTGYFINDILTENVLQNMYDSGDCSATFG